MHSPLGDTHISAAAQPWEVDTHAFVETVPGALWKVGHLTPAESCAVRAAAADWPGATPAQLRATKAILVGMVLGDPEPGEWPRGFVEGFRGRPFDDYVFLEFPEPRGGKTEFVFGVYQRGFPPDKMTVYYARLADRAVITNDEVPAFGLLRDVLLLSHRIDVYNSGQLNRRLRN